MSSLKIIRAATIGTSLETFCLGLLSALQQRGYEICALSSPDDDLCLLGKRENVRTIGVSMDRQISIKKDIISLFSLVKVFHAEKPDMVHSMTPKAGLLCMIAAWLTRVPVRVHTFTGLVWPTATGFSRKILMMTDRITCACATYVIPEGQGVLENLRDYGITKKPMKVLGYGNVRGVDMEKYSLRPEVVAKAVPLKKENTFTFIFVGRIVGDKGINELIRAFERLLKCPAAEGVKPRLILVGRFEEELDPVSAETRRLIDSLLEIEAVGPQFGDDLLAWYAASDCFVFPSYREGFPNTVLEAGALGLPSIVTDINGSREIITNADYQPKKLAAGEIMSIRKNGVVIPSKNEDALFDAMRWMIENSDARLHMAECARKMVADRFEQGFVRQCLYDFYDKVLKDTKSK